MTCLKDVGLGLKICIYYFTGALQGFRTCLFTVKKRECKMFYTFYFPSKLEAPFMKLNFFYYGLKGLDLSSALGWRVLRDSGHLASPRTSWPVGTRLRRWLHGFFSPLGLLPHYQCLLHKT